MFGLLGVCRQIVEAEARAPEKEDEDDSAQEDEGELMGLDSYLYGRTARLNEVGLERFSEKEIAYLRKRDSLHEWLVEEFMHDLDYPGIEIELNAKGIDWILECLIRGKEPYDLSQIDLARADITAFASARLWLNGEERQTIRTIVYKAEN